MKKRILTLTLSVVFILALIPGAAADFTLKLPAAQLPSLREIYKNDFLISSPFNTIFADQYFPTIRQHYNAVWMGNMMKPESLSWAKGYYNFSDMDKIVQLLSGADIQLYGHTLVWHQQTPNWLNKRSDGAPLSRAEANQNLTDYIHTVAGHFAGKVYAWDVVNEVFEDNGQTDWRSALRKEVPWYKAFANGAKSGESGADYIETAFRLARAADPGATLYINDYNLNNQAKAAALASLVQEINDKWLAEGNDRLLIEGVGMQGHYTITIDVGDVERSIQRFIGLGVEVSITEMELSLFEGEINSDWSRAPTPELYAKQAEVCAKLFQVFKKYSAHIARVNCNGVWIRSGWRNFNYPTLFDEYNYAKLAYFAAADPEGYLAGNFDTDAKCKAWIEDYNAPKPPEAPNLTTAHDWARSGIQSAYIKGFIPADLQNNYTNIITRQEFCRMAVKWVEYKTGKSIDTLLSEKGLSRRQDAFSDTTDPDILAAYALEIISGDVAPTATTPGKFNPNGQFNREQAATMIRNVWNALNLDTRNVQDAGFVDISTASGWAADAINFCSNNSIMNGTSVNPKTFSPKDTYTREESILTFNNMP